MSEVTREEFKAVEERLGKLENRVTRSETQILNITDTLNKIDSNTTWLLRIIVGTILVAVLYLVVQKPEAITSGVIRLFT